jgi:CHAT domain-containing protein
MKRHIKLILSAIILIAGANYKSFAAVLSDVLPLRPNAPITREFKGGERRLFSIEARSGEALEIIADKKAVDIGLAAYSPIGEKIVVSNAPGGFTGRETLFFIAEKSGKYQIEVASKRPGNLSGEFTITLTNQSSAKSVDTERAAAMKSFGEAREILYGSENRIEKAAAAIAKLETALASFEKLNDLQNQANALFHIAYITGNEFGNEQAAIKNYEKALEIWRKIDDDAGRAICLTHAANEIRDGGDYEKSLIYLNEALSLNKKLDDQRGEAVTLSFLCRWYNNKGDFQKGFETCRVSLRLNLDSDPLTDYVTYSNLAALYENTGDFENSLKNYQASAQRISLVKDYLNPIRLANVKGNTGVILSLQKKYAEAAPYFLEAVAVSEAVKRPIYAAYYLAQLSENFLITEQPSKALEYAEKALDIYRRLAPHKRQVALNIAGKSYAALGQTEKARELYAEALLITRQKKDPYAEAETLYNLAQLEKTVGNTDAAQQDIGQAINISEILRAELLGKNQRSSYLAILKRFYELQIELHVTLYEKTGDERFSEKAWQNQEKIRARSLFENYVESGFDLNEITSKEFFADEQKLLKVIADAALKRDNAAKTNKPDAQKKAETNLQKAFDEHQVFQEEARRRNPRFAAVSQPRDFSFDESQKLLDENTAFLEFSMGEKQSYAWLISQNSVKLAKLPTRNLINQAAREFYAALTDRDAKNQSVSIEKSARLSKLILQPFAADLSKFKRLIVIADGSLQLVPFAALTLSPNEFQPLAASVEIINAPSFSSLVYQKESQINRRTATDRRLAIFADPIFQEDDERFGMAKNQRRKNTPISTVESAKLAQTLRDFGVERLARLPFTSIEAKEIAKFAPQQTVLALGANASRGKFLNGDYNSYKILHFATHGFLNQQNPDLSGLVLSLYDEKRQSQNGFLRVIDLYSLKLNADLVVLSACQTGLGKEVDGEGIIGLTRGFMFAGASSVVSSLWKVEDAATAELMKRFYRAMLKENQSPSAALRTAQNELRQIPRWRNSNNWAGFTLTGEWRKN